MDTIHPMEVAGAVAKKPVWEILNISIRHKSPTRCTRRTPKRTCSRNSPETAARWELLCSHKSTFLRSTRLESNNTRSFCLHPPLRSLEVLHTRFLRTHIKRFLSCKSQCSDTKTYLFVEGSFCSFLSRSLCVLRMSNRLSLQARGMRHSRVAP